MGGFFRKLFKDDTDGITKKDEDDVISLVTSELMVEDSIINDGSQDDTNRLPEFSTVENTEAFKDFSGYSFVSESSPGMIRESNQDSTYTGEFKFCVANKLISAGLGIVADGMGGLSMGEIASSTAIASVSTYMVARLSEYIQDSTGRKLPHGQVILGHMSDAMKNANRIVWDKGAALGESIGTTFTYAFVIGDAAYFGHVGDSRAYIIDTENKSIERVTRDHSLVGRLVEMGHITDKEAKRHPRRNEIYRMLGLKDKIDVDTYYRIINKNSIIMLMSDGLWEFVDDSDMLNEFLQSSDLSRSAKTLVDMANKNGGHDNISLVIIRPL